MKNINIDGTDYQLVPVVETLEWTGRGLDPSNGPQKQLYYANGACLYPLVKGQTYWSVGDDYELLVHQWEETPVDWKRLEARGAYLTFDGCALSADVMKVHARLLKRIVEINARTNWQIDDPESENWSLEYCLTNNKKVCQNSRPYAGPLFMSRLACDYMMEQVHHEDFVKFLQIYTTN